MPVKKKKIGLWAFIFTTFYLQQEDTASTSRYCNFSWSSTYAYTKIHENVPERAKWFYSFLCHFGLWYMNVCAGKHTWLHASVCLNNRYFSFLSPHQHQLLCCLCKCAAMVESFAFFVLSLLVLNSSWHFNWDGWAQCICLWNWTLFSAKRGCHSVTLLPFSSIKTPLKQTPGL